MNQSAFNDKVNAPKSEESLIPSFLRKVFDMLEVRISFLNRVFNNSYIGRLLHLVHFMERGWANRLDP